jgi:hypothetical protein
METSIIAWLVQQSHLTIFGELLEIFTRPLLTTRATVLNEISCKRMVQLTISFMFTMIATTAFTPRCMTFSTFGSKTSVHRLLSTTSEVSYRRKVRSHGWTLRQKMAMLGSDIWVLQFDGGSRGKLLSTSYKCSNLDEFFIGHQVLYQF